MPAAVICGLGARTPIGLSADAFAAAHRAGISALAEHPFMIDKRGEPMLVAMDPTLPSGLSGPERAANLALAAVDDLLWRLEGRDMAVDLLLATPSPRPGWSAKDTDWLVERLHAHVQAHMTCSAPAFIPHDHVAGAVMLGEAARKLADRGAEACLTVAVDSLIEPETLEWIDAGDRLFGEENPFGLTPGEAAAALMVTTPAHAARLRLDPLAAILGRGRAKEPTHGTGDRPNIGEGLAEAVRLATEPIASTVAKVDQLICDLTGEPPRADEFGYMLVRRGDRLAPGMPFEVLADRIGDTGAAFGALAAIVAAVAGMKGYAAGPLQMISSSSSNGRRAALLMKVRNGNHAGAAP